MPGSVVRKCPDKLEMAHWEDAGIRDVGFVEINTYRPMFVPTVFRPVPIAAVADTCPPLSDEHLLGLLGPPSPLSCFPLKCQMNKPSF